MTDTATLTESELDKKPGIKERALSTLRERVFMPMTARKESQKPYENMAAGNMRRITEKLKNREFIPSYFLPRGDSYH